MFVEYAEQTVNEEIKVCTALTTSSISTLNFLKLTALQLAGGAESMAKYNKMKKIRRGGFFH